MKFGAKLAAFLCIAVVLTTSGMAADKKLLSDALAAVDANLKTDSGKQYDAKIGQEFPTSYLASVKQCKQSNPTTSFDPFDVFLKLNPEGKVQESLAYPETALAVCTRNALQSAQFSSPPHGEYWINIHLQPKR